jgi:hypothetical protein
MNHYVNNGEGRDFYISYNSGGNTVKIINLSLIMNNIRLQTICSEAL